MTITNFDRFESFISNNKIERDKLSNKIEDIFLNRDFDFTEAAPKSSRFLMFFSRTLYYKIFTEDAKEYTKTLINNYNNACDAKISKVVSAILPTLNVSEVKSACVSKPLNEKIISEEARKIDLFQKSTALIQTYTDKIKNLKENFPAVPISFDPATKKHDSNLETELKLGWEESLNQVKNYYSNQYNTPEQKDLFNFEVIWYENKDLPIPELKDKMDDAVKEAKDKSKVMEEVGTVLKNTIETLKKQYPALKFENLNVSQLIKTNVHLSKDELRAKVLDTFAKELSVKTEDLKAHLDVSIKSIFLEIAKDLELRQSIYIYDALEVWPTDYTPLKDHILKAELLYKDRPHKWAEFANEFASVFEEMEKFKKLQNSTKQFIQTPIPPPKPAQPEVKPAEASSQEQLKEDAEASVQAEILNSGRLKEEQVDASVQAEVLNPGRLNEEVKPLLTAHDIEQKVRAQLHLVAESLALIVNNKNERQPLTKNILTALSLPSVKPEPKTESERKEGDRVALNYAEISSLATLPLSQLNKNIVELLEDSSKSIPNQIISLILIKRILDLNENEMNQFSSKFTSDLLSWIERKPQVKESLVGFKAGQKLSLGKTFDQKFIDTVAERITSPLIKLFVRPLVLQFKASKNLMLDYFIELRKGIDEKNAEKRVQVISKSAPIFAALLKQLKTDLSNNDLFKKFNAAYNLHSEVLKNPEFNESLVVNQFIDPLIEAVLLKPKELVTV